MEFTGQYLTYDEYKALGGNLDQTPFNLSEMKARKIIDKYTQGRLIDLETQVQEVKLCVYDLINLGMGYDSSGDNYLKNRGISSESTDGYSVSFGSVSSDTVKTRKEEEYNIVFDYLAECKLEDGTPYLYRGIDDNKRKFNNLP